jgi:flagella basal body P-ring formation protein FlgA
MKNKICFIFFSLFCIQAQARPEIKFNAVTRVTDRAEYSLYDLAAVQSGSEQLFSALKSIPYNGGGLSELQSSLRKLKSHSVLFAEQQPTVSIPTEIKTLKEKNFSSSEFRRKLTNVLSAKCPDCRFDIYSIKDEKVNLDASWSIDHNTVQVNGSFLVSLRDSTAKINWVPIQMRVYRSVVRNKRVILQGEKIQAENLEKIETDITYIKDPVVSIEEALMQTSAKYISSGKFLVASDLKQDYAVKNGQVVLLTSEGDGFEVTTQASSQSQGKVGDLIKLKNTTTGQVMSAIVTGHGQARIE